MAFGLALAAATVLGMADFTGGLATRRAGVVPVLILSRVTGLAVLAAAVILFPAVDLRASDIAWGALAGLAGGIGIALLYHGLATGVMSAVAPITAVCAASVPALAGLALGDRPSFGAGVGMALAIGAIAVISMELHRATGGEEASVAAGRTGLVKAFAAGLAIGAFYVLVSRASAQALLWPLVAARGSALVLFVSFGLVCAHRLWPAADVLPTAVAAATLDVGGTVLYLLAVYQGPLSLVAVLTSLYPASTIVLAMLVLGERFTMRGIAGLVCAAVGACLIVGT